jgi:hypothetical protein
MSIQALLNAALAVNSFLAVLTEGMVISGADVRYLSSTPVRVARTPLAMNVLGPIVCRTFSLHSP